MTPYVLPLQSGPSTLAPQKAPSAIPSRIAPTVSLLEKVSPRKEEPLSSGSMKSVRPESVVNLLSSTIRRHDGDMKLPWWY